MHLAFRQEPTGRLGEEGLKVLSCRFVRDAYGLERLLAFHVECIINSIAGDAATRTTSVKDRISGSIWFLQYNY